MFQGRRGRRRALTALLVTAATVGATACSGSSGAGPAPTASVTATPAPIATTPAAEELSTLLGRAARARYAAVYVAAQRHAPRRATWRVWRTPSSLRVDVVTHRSTATLIVTPRAAFACRAAGHRVCFRVAKGGRPIPPLFRLLAQRLFSTDVETLDRHLDRYAVSRTGSRSAHGPVPAAECFAVRPRPSAPSPRVARGVYCLSADGLLTAVRYPSGSSVRLQRITGRPPARHDFTPYASPTPLPG